MPTTSEAIKLGDSKEIALKLFFFFLKKLDSNLNLRHKYTEFINEYLPLNHTKLVPQAEMHRSRDYLSHHAVFKEASSTAKLRVVFDASAKTTNGLSLNGNLLPGPTIQQDLLSILSAFRTDNYAFTVDISKMFREIKIINSKKIIQKL